MYMSSGDASKNVASARVGSSSAIPTVFRRFCPEHSRTLAASQSIMRDCPVETANELK